MEQSRKKSSSLAVSLIAAIGLSVAILTVAQVVTLSELAKSYSRTENVNSYVRWTNAVKSQILLTLEGFYKDLQVYIGADIMETGNIEAVGEWLTQNAELRTSEYDYIMIAGADGIAYTDIGKRTDISGRDYFQAIMKKGQARYVDDPVVSKTTGEKVVHITTGLYDDTGRLFAMLAGVINVNNLVRPIKELDVPKGVWPFLIESNGGIIYHPAAVEGGNFLTGVDEAHKDLVIYTKKMLSGESGHVMINSWTGSKKDMLVYSGVDGTPWGLGMTIPGRLIESLGISIRNIAIMFGLIVLAMILIIGSILLVQSLKPLKLVENAINEIATGNADLTKRINLKSNNEIGQVVTGFNMFAEKMQNIIRDVKNSKEELNTAGQDMNVSSQNTTHGISEILGDINNAHTQLSTQSSCVSETAGAVHEISANIASLEKLVEHQSVSVSQASSAVEQMIGNIQSVNDSVDVMAGSFKDLHAKASDGYERQQDVNERILQIENQSKMLEEANAAIAAIASQTNLLAMNAAIEAAHAGDTGKGFSVVADEIRKLSETSSGQSKTIGEQLRNIQDSIKEVVQASGETSTVFESVSKKIQETDQMVLHIKAAMEEQAEGSKQISIALRGMNESTLEVRNASSEMAIGNNAILEEVKRLQDSSLAMQTSMDNMTVNAERIKQTGQSLDDISDKMKNSIEKIGSQIDLFKV